MEKSYNAAAASPGRLIVARILPNQDLIENIERICVEYGIQYGVIVSAIGSLRQVSLNVVTRTTPKPPNGHMEHVTLEGPFSLLAGQGVIAPAEDPEKRDVHFHISVRGEKDDIEGGHVEYGTRTLSTTDLSIQEIHGIRVKRVVDQALGVKMTAYEQE